MDTSDIGQYGTLRLVKRQDALSVVASYPIDEESLTFGRDPTCSVRLYYPGVSGVHAKIFFEERKVSNEPSLCCVLIIRGSSFRPS